MAKQQKAPCKYGKKCYRKNQQHLDQYGHQEIEMEHSLNRRVCLVAPIADNGDVLRSTIDSMNAPSACQTVEEESSKAKAKKRKTEDDVPAPNPKKKTITDFFSTNKAKAEKKRSEEKGKQESEDEEDVEAAEGIAKASTSKERDDDEKEPTNSTKVVEDEDDKAAAPDSPEDIKDNVKQKFLLDMPEDFYAFWDFAKSVKSADPNTAFKRTLGLELVGPFDILGGRHKKSKTKNPCYLRHWRYYFDPPEFMTIVTANDESQFHMGYFRDDPKEMPAFVASNAAATNCTIMARGDNIFAAFSWYIDDYLKKNKTKKDSLNSLKNDIAAAAKKGGFSLDQKSKGMKERDKKVNCKLFHSAGMVVPVDENDVGYREVPETPGDLKKMFKKVVDAKTEKDRDAAFDPLMEIIMLIQFANDECDYGEGLELGLNMFSYGGDVFKSNVINLMGLAYQLLGRHEYRDILEAHMESRSRSANLSQLD